MKMNTMAPQLYLQAIDQLLKYKMSWLLFNRLYPRGDERGFRSMFGISTSVLDRILLIANHLEIKSSTLDLMWVFSFLKSYSSMDALHTGWNVSYNTFNQRVWHVLVEFYKKLNTIDFRIRKDPNRWKTIHKHTITCVVDCTECKINRPTDSILQRSLYSGYKGYTTFKYQVICTADGKRIINVRVSLNTILLKGTTRWTTP